MELDRLGAQIIPIGDLLLSTTDTFYFSNTGRELVAACITVPEDAQPSAELLERLDLAPPSWARPILKKGTQGVMPLACESTWIDASGQRFVDRAAGAGDNIHIQTCH